MKVLITGGAGFLGTALANTLARMGTLVRVIDDLSSGNPSRLDSAVHFTRGDVADVPKLWSILQGVDCVYHLAARVSVPESVLYPREYNETNVGGTVALMQAMRDAGVRRVVLASSGAVYGEQAEQPLRETCIPSPASPYAVSKLAAEYYTHTIGALWGIETVALRIFNAYGPGQMFRPSHPPVIPAIVRQALSGGSIIVHGSGKQTRDFVYVDDVVSALISAAGAPSVNRLTINVGSGTEISINGLVQTVGRVLGKSLNVLHVTAESGGVSRMMADLSRAEERLNYRPRVSLEDGLQRVIQAFQQAA
ncbi:MAG: NAD-dependent epimerase/dehydratase family protein [Anaerolineae bacterium]|nr:NAD-dependent epimerase/dehydratase family protein [Thermoflexales bacterium]MDW8408159.1 NAD-dependent epimerase/dehydratase family protein [Anaerolineae bacterium]